MDLASLNTASAKVGTFPVRVLTPVIDTYTFLKDGKSMEGCSFRCLLLGTSATSYCVGTWRGSKKDVQACLARFANGSTWSVSKVVFDQRAKAEYISAPIKTVVSLNNSTVQPATMADHPDMLKPQYSLSAVARIETSNLYFDVLGLVKEVSDVLTYEEREKRVAYLLDDGMKLVSIGIWDDATKDDSKSLVKQIAKLANKVVLITGIKSLHREGNLNLNTSKTSVILQHEDSGLDASSLQQVDKEKCETLTVSTLRPQIDWNEPAAHTCLNMLAHTSNTDAVFQASLQTKKR